MTLVDLTIVNIAIPKMTDDLGASLDEVLWVINAYALALATLIITAGRLGDLRGKGNLFIGGVALFTLASLACGLSANPGQLIAFRAIQGIGAALLIPQTLSIVVEVFPLEKRGAALGAWGAIAGLSGVVGPTLGGLLVEHLSWRWVFFVNVPLGALTLLLAIPLMPKATRTIKHRFDIPGVVLASITMFCLAFALIEGQRYNWDAWIWAMIAGSVVLAGVFLVYERGQQENEPLLPFSLFKSRNFSVVNFVGVAVSFGVIGLLLPTTIYLQSVLGFSALKTGLVLLPLAGGTMLTAGPAGVLAERYGGRFVLTFGLAAFGAGMVWILTMAGSHTPWTSFVAPLIVSGMGVGCTFAPMASEVMRGVPPRLTGAASGVNNALRQMGSVIAGSVVGAVLQAQLVSQLRDSARASAHALPPGIRSSFVGAFSHLGAHGLEVGKQDTSGTAALHGIPAGLARTVRQVAEEVYRHGFVGALRPTMLVPAIVMFVGALICLTLKGGPPPAGAAHGVPFGETEQQEAAPATVKS
jgi:EmrB/QacA subfamily drug resistance transporter